MASRMGWLFGEERSALYPAALIAAMTVNRLGLASIDPASAARAAAGRQVIKTVAITKRSNGSALDTISLPQSIAGLLACACPRSAEAETPKRIRVEVASEQPSCARLGRPGGLAGRPTPLP